LCQITTFLVFLRALYRNIYSLGLGVKKDIETGLLYKPYVSASAGYAILDWKTSPLNSNKI